jgi:hypothetical protein
VAHKLLTSLCDRPEFIGQSFAEFEKAVKTACDGNLDAGLVHLERTRHVELRTWFKEIAQVAGPRRFSELGSPAAETPEIPSGDRDSRDIGKPLARQVLQRDRYHCRYCGVPVIYVDEAQRLRTLFGAERFAMSQDNDIAHGTLRAFYNSFDHVTPRSRGGRNTADNIVTACYPCNFGKDGFTLKQLGLSSPFENPIIEDGHDGFVSLLQVKTPHNRGIRL